MATTSKSTQDFVPIKEVRDGIVILKDGSLSAILMTSSINFALKSQDEQMAILFQFQNFLNSLEFSIQIFIQSRDLDIRPYIALLEERRTVQVDDLMRIQIQEYIEFVKNFTESASIMTKNFFVIVPYTPSALQGKHNIFQIFGVKKSDKKQDENSAFEENRTQLQQRVSVVEQGLVRTGIRFVQLGTEEVIELYYKMFNPGEMEKPISLNQ